MEKNNKLNIALITGGFSKERVISLSSADRLIEDLKLLEYNIFVFDIVSIDDWWYVQDHKIKEILYGHEWVYKKKYKLELDSFSLKINDDKLITFDYAYVIVHNHPAEDGEIQMIFEKSGIPYSCCNSLTSAITMCKYSAKKFLEKLKVVQTPRYIFINRNDLLLLNWSQLYENIIKIMKFPIIIKPNNEGSSLGSIVIKDNLLNDSIRDAIYKVLYSDSREEVLIEEFIQDKREFTVGVVKFDDLLAVLPITEIGHGTNNDILSYNDKYFSSNKPEITPAKIDPLIAEKIIKISNKIYLLFNCNGIIRIDYLLVDNEIYFLELNSIPGMTKTSFIPQQIEAMTYDDFRLLGIDTKYGKIADFLNIFIKKSILSYNRKKIQTVT